MLREKEAGVAGLLAVISLLSILFLINLAACTPQDPIGSEPPPAASPTPPPVEKFTMIANFPIIQDSKMAGTLALQKALNARGAKLAEDGSYGDKTTAAVKAQKTAIGLAPNGYAGLATLEALGLRVAGERPLLWTGRRAGVDEWTSHLVSEIEKRPTLLAVELVDAGEWCPNWSKLSRADRVQFFAHFIAGMTRWESNNNPNSSTPECKKGECLYNGNCFTHPTLGQCMKGGHAADGGVVISRGPIQLSFGSALGLGCKLSKPSDLNDPFMNFTCGVQLLNGYVTEDRRIAGKVAGKWKGMARYFAVVRGTRTYTEMSLNHLRGFMLDFPGCVGGGS